MKTRKTLAITGMLAIAALAFGFSATTSKAVAGGRNRTICINYEGSAQCDSSAGAGFATNCTNWSFGTYDDSEFGTEGEVLNSAGDLSASWTGTLNVTQNADGTCTW